MINERLIDAYGKTIPGFINNVDSLEQLVNLRLNRGIDGANPKSNDLASIDACDHYIVKMLITDPSKLERNMMIAYRDKLYNIFLSHPEIAYDSIFFRQNVAKLLFTTSQYEEIKKYKTSQCQSVYTKVSNLIKVPNNRITEDVLRFAIYQIGNTNEKCTTFLDELYKYMIRNRQNNDSYYAKEFILKYSSFLAAKDLGIPMCSVYISNYKLYGQEMSQDNLGTSYGNSGVITINRNSLLKNHTLYKEIPGLYNYMMVIAHETRHSLQAYDAAKNKITAAGFEMLRSNIFSKYLSDKEYSEYHSNYLHSEIESDANEYGWYFTYKTISKLNAEDAKNIEEISSKRIKQAYQELTPTKINKSENRHEEAWKYNVTKMNEIIKAHPVLVNTSTALRAIYNPDGERKSFIELLKEQQKYHGDDADEIEKIFKDYYTYAIASGEIKSINVSTLDQETQFLLFKQVANQLIDEYQNIKNSIKMYNKYENISEFRQKEFAFVSEKRVARINVMVDFLNANRDLINKLTEIDVSDVNKRFFGMTFNYIDRTKESVFKYLPKLEQFGITDEKTIKNLNSLTENEYVSGKRGR